jgi:hypothetical protein
MLDRVRPKKTRIRHSTVIHPEVIEQPSVLSGVIALAPFLGFDFSLPTARLGPDRFAQWRLARCRGALASLFGGGVVARPQDHGCWSDQGRVRWADLAQRLPFASVAQTLPSLKRPTVLVLDAKALGRPGRGTALRIKRKSDGDGFPDGNAAGRTRYTCGC